MPNWVRNKLYIGGPAQGIAAFKAKARTSYIPEEEGGQRRQTRRKPAKPIVIDLSFSQMVPIPPAVFKKPEIKLGYNCVQDPVIPWCIKHWGCKWDAYNPELMRESKNRLFYFFCTPWDPPYEWLKRVSRQYPKLRFNLHYWDSAPRVIIRAINGHLKDNRP